MALTVDRKNMILEKLRTIPEREWRSLDPKDLDQREAIKYIIRNDQLSGWEVQFKDDTYSKVSKRKKHEPIGEWTGLCLPDPVWSMPPHPMRRIFSMNLRPEILLYDNRTI